MSKKQTKQTCRVNKSVFVTWEDRWDPSSVVWLDSREQQHGLLELSAHHLCMNLAWEGLTRKKEAVKEENTCVCLHSQAWEAAPPMCQSCDAWKGCQLQ